MEAHDDPSRKSMANLGCEPRLAAKSDTVEEFPEPPYTPRTDDRFPTASPLGMGPPPPNWPSPNGASVPSVLTSA